MTTFTDNPSVSDERRPESPEQQERSEPLETPESYSRRPSMLLFARSVVVDKELSKLYPSDDTKSNKVCSLSENYTALASVLILVAWSCMCVFLTERIHERYSHDPLHISIKWLEWLEGTQLIVMRIGGIFTFASIFRFQTCYNRWWEGRIIWGDMIATCIDLNQMAISYFRDSKSIDTFSRNIILYAYASKSILRHECVVDVDGEYLLRKEVMTQNEIQELSNCDCWQPHYALDKLRQVIADIFARGGDALTLADNRMPVNAQVLRSLENNITKLHDHLGNAIRIRSTGLPQTYDFVHTLLFYTYFILAPVSLAQASGWAMPVMIGIFAPICLALIHLGTDMIDPFGNDCVDLPLEIYCKTIEVLVNQGVKNKCRSDGLFSKSRTLSKGVNGVGQRCVSNNLDPQDSTASLASSEDKCFDERIFSARISMS